MLSWISVRLGTHVTLEVKYILFDSGGKCVVMVTVRLLTLGFQVLTFLVIVALCFHGLQLDLAHILALRWRCEQHIVWQWRKVCCHGNGILWKSLEEKFVNHITSTFWGISNKIWHTCWRAKSYNIKLCAQSAPQNLNLCMFSRIVMLNF